MHEVLVIDDIAKNIEVVSEILYQRGIEVSFALSGEEGLNIAEHRLPDLVLLDIAMPGMDGFEVCRRLKRSQQTSEIPVIFLTAKKDSSDIVRGFEAGGVDYITKPFNSAELLSRVQTQLMLKENRDVISRQNQELRNLNDQKDRFFSIVAHDLKNPFNGFLGMTQLMKDDFDDLTRDEIRDYVSDLYDSSRQLYKLLDNLLTWSRLQLETVSTNPGKVDVKHLIVNTIELYKENAVKKHIDIQYSCPDDLHVFADVEMVYTMLRNLISNAIKYIDKEGRITIEAQRREDGSDDVVEIRVSDTGIGMDEDTIRHLFTLDRRPLTPGTDGERGTGLGLILCKEFALRNGGDIEATGTPGGGSVFTIFLPTHATE